jgi:hypothetical protein
MVMNAAVPSTAISTHMTKKVKGLISSSGVESQQRGWMFLKRSDASYAPGAAPELARSSILFRSL